MQNRSKYYLAVTPFFPSEESFRGSFVYDQVKTIQRQTDYSVVVFLARKKSEYVKGIKEYMFNGIRVVVFPMKWPPSYLFNGIFNGYNSRSFIRTAMQNGINFNDVDIIHCHTSSFGACGLAARNLNHSIRILLQHHDADPFCIRNGRLALWRLNARYRARKNIHIFNEVDCHICISEKVKNNLLAFPSAGNQETYGPYLRVLKLMEGLSAIRPKRVEILYNGVDTSIFNPGKKNKPKELFSIGCVGNFQPLKAQDILIKAVAKLFHEKILTNFQLKLVGSGPMLGYCKKLAEELQISDNCKFIIEMPHQSLPEFYRSLDLFVLPTEFEGFGCVFTEAAACGVPFMIPKNQGASEYIPVNEQRYWTFTPGNVDELADLIHGYYKNRGREQHYCHAYDIDELIWNFIKTL